MSMFLDIFVSGKKLSGLIKIVAGIYSVTVNHVHTKSGFHSGFSSSANRKKPKRV